MGYIIEGRYIITDPIINGKGILTDAAVYVSGDKIKDIGTYHILKKKYPDAIVKGSNKQLVMPGLINAHSHGAGLSPFQQGVAYDYLENFLIDKPKGTTLDYELNAILCAIRHLRNGCTTLHHNQSGNEMDVNNVRKILNGYKKVGIRVAYSSGVRDLNMLTYDDKELYKKLPLNLKKYFKPFIFKDKELIQKQYFEHFHELFNLFNNENRKIIYGPLWVQGCTDEFLVKIKDDSTKMGRIPIHIHTLQTLIQKNHGEKKYGKSLLFHLKDLGLVDDLLVLGHAVFINEEDIGLLAEKNSSITHHASCNLAVRNGIAPVYYLQRAGVNVALGIDDKGINDDEDPFMEMRMIYYLHRAVGSDLTSSKPLNSYDVFKMATLNAARVCHFNGLIGALRIGMKADLLLLDLNRILEDPWVNPCWNIMDTIIHRAKGSDVSSVMVNGEFVIENRKFCNIDIDSIYEEVKTQIKKGNSQSQIEYAEHLQQIKKYCQEWHNQYFTGDLSPFYKMNSRK